MIEQIAGWLKRYAIENNLPRFVIGVSGGVDSAVVSTLCAKTGLDTICVLMPLHQNPEHTLRGRNHVKWLQENFTNVQLMEYDLTNVFEVFKETVGEQSDALSLANTRSRLRMVTLYNIAQHNYALVVGTGNKVEDFGVGFFTKYGDGGVDISPIADLMKSEVYDLGRALGINEEILTAVPTDGLWDDDRNDEEQLGARYTHLEWAMQYEGDGETGLHELQKKALEVYKHFNKVNQHKMQPIPVWKKE